jgi:segregation and condensation protein A
MNDAALPSDAPQENGLSVPAAQSLRTAVSNRIDFSASLESFQGPLDLLLHLIKENEVDVADIPVAKILEQYLRFMEQESAQWDLQLAGEFLVMAVTLMEIKSRELLPVQPENAEAEEIIEDPRSELVRQLLAYRRLKEQARVLELMQESWQACRPRGYFGDVPDPVAAEDAETGLATAKEALVDVDLYGVFAAYERILKSVLAQTPRNIVYDTESIEEKIARIETLLKTQPFARFADLVADPNSRADIAGTFVALLELVRRRAVRLVQDQEYGNIDVRTQVEGEGEESSRMEAAAAEAAAEEALKAKAIQDAQALETDKLPWARRRAAAAKPKFEGLLKPEDVEEIDAEEQEIGRRIDAILAAADAISERFEQSREGRIRDDNAPVEDIAPIESIAPVENASPAAPVDPVEPAAPADPVENTSPAEPPLPPEESAPEAPAAAPQPEDA